MLMVVVSCVAASRGDQGRIGDWGLIQALPPLYFVGAAGLSVSFVLEAFRRARRNTAVLFAHVLGAVIVLHGAPAFVEQEPRFATAWLHAGFTNQILDHGVAVPGFDARFNWPGFFGAAAAVTGSGGLESAVSLLRWAPVVMVLLTLPPLYLIGRQLTGSVRAAWLGLWLYLTVNWVGQTYFAPQSIGYVLYLVAIAILVTFFRQGTPHWLRPRRPRHEAESVEGFPDVGVQPGTRVALAVLLVALSAALAMTHQLSPVMLVLATAALVVVGRCRLIAFPVVAAILTLGWISVGATAYWSGHLDVIFGNLGHITSVLETSVGDRVGGSPTHLTIVSIRLVFTAAVWAAMALSAVVLWFRGQRPITLFVLAVAPLGLVAQNYGTEGVLRIFLFSSPFAAMLVAQLLASIRIGHPMRLFVTVLALALIPTFLITRYGNESYEQTRVNEVQAAEALNKIAPKGSKLISATTQVPWGFEFLVDYRYVRPTHQRAFRDGNLHAVRYPVNAAAHPDRANYLMITTGQVVYASQAEGDPPDWFARLRAELTPTNGYRLVYSNPDAWIYEYEAPR
jgi:hypothetical protein